MSSTHFQASSCTAFVQGFVHCRGSENVVLSIHVSEENHFDVKIDKKSFGAARFLRIACKEKAFIDIFIRSYEQKMLRTGYRLVVEGFPERGPTCGEHAVASSPSSPMSSKMVVSTMLSVGTDLFDTY